MWRRFTKFHPIIRMTTTPRCCTFLESNPGDACMYMEQCTSVTPNAYCNSNGICQCNSNQRPFPALDGPVCILPGECPTNGMNSKLRDPDSGADVRCPNGPTDCHDLNSLSNSNEQVY